MTSNHQDLSETSPEQAACSLCGGTSIHPADVSSAIWLGKRLVVVDDIPALVCDDCHERFFDDNTAMILDLLRGDGFRKEDASGEIQVPVFSFRDRAADLKTRRAGAAG
jgi:YgiT-type zinc finger domain-containing protein